MINILFSSTIVLDVAAFIFAAVFLWINISGKYDDLPDRNANTIKITKVSMITSFIFALLTSLLSNSEEVADAIAKSAILYSIIAITWLVVVVACGITMLITVISKKYYKPQLVTAVKRLFIIALPSVIVGLVLTWLFS